MRKQKARPGRIAWIHGRRWVLSDELLDDPEALKLWREAREREGPDPRDRPSASPSRRSGPA